MPPEAVSCCEIKLKNRFDEVKTIKGTQQFHRYVPVSSSVVKVYKLSQQEEQPKQVRIVGTGLDDCATSRDPITIKPQDYVCVIYEEKPWIGLVEECSDEYGDYYINFMHPHSPVKFLYWPDPIDKCWTNESDILCVIDAPMIAASGQRIRYKLTAMTM